MKLVYLANIRLPTEKAHGVQIMKMCEAFAHAGEAVTLIVPARRTHITEDPFAYYGVEKIFSIIYVPVWDTVTWGRLGFLLESFIFAARAARVARSAEGVVYGRDELVLMIAWMRGARHTVWESHTGAWNVAARFLARRLSVIVVISKGLKDFYVSKGIATASIIVAHDGVDPRAFEHLQSKSEARQRLGLPQDAKLAMYIGSLGEGKGAHTLCEAAALLGDTRVAIIGGTESEVAALHARYPQVLFVGQRPYRELASNQAAADVLVIPNSGRLVTWSAFTSPLKLFAAMLSQVPIVASDVPSIREVLDTTCAYLVEPDNAQALAGGIQEALGAEAQGKVAAAQARARGYYWDTRAKNILAFLTSRGI